LASFARFGGRFEGFVGRAQLAFGFAVAPRVARRDRARVGAGGDRRVRFFGQAATDPFGDQLGARFGAGFDRVEAVGLHQLRVRVDEGRPVGRLRAGA